MTDTASSSPAPVSPLPPSKDDPHDRRVFYLGAGILIAVFVVILLLFLREIPASNKDVLNTVIGFLVGTGAGSVVSFYYGTSASSKAKDDTISTLSKG